METITITESGIYQMGQKQIEQLIIKADDVTIKNLSMINLSEKSVKILGDNVTLENCSFNGNEKSTQLIQVKGSKCHITNCLFENINEKGVLIAIIVSKSKPSYCLIDNNNFREMKEGMGIGWEVIRIGDSKTSLYDSKSIIYNNFFSHCDRDIELISVKSCANIIVYNKIIDCKSGIVLNHGVRNKVLYNYINGNHREGCCGIRISGKEHIIKGNTIEKIINKDNPYRTAISIMNGEVDNKLNGYQPVKLLQIINNDILSCDVAFSIGVHNKLGIQVNPHRVSIEDNRIVKCLEVKNDNKKCEGMINSYMGLNEVIEEDIKLVIHTAPDITTSIEDLYISLNTGKVLDEEEEKDIGEIKNPPPKKIIIDNFDDVLEEIERLKELDNTENECSRCEDLLNTLNKNQEITDKKIKELEKELNFWRSRYNKIEGMLLQQLKN